MRASVVVSLAAFLAAAGGAACARSTSATDIPAPRRRMEGPRAIPFAGGDPLRKGWTKVDGLLWVETSDLDAWNRGEVRLGSGYASFAQADRVPKSPEEGYVLRTDHLVLRTDAPFARARELARLSEEHIDRVLAVYGEPLDLRLPADPLRIVVAAQRADFTRLLAARVPAPVDWGAFYEAADGTVYASDERRERGGLSGVADLRHELTHAILDLGRPESGRARMFVRPHFWVWEGAAIWTEGLGDPPDARQGRERFARFQRRFAWGDVVPLPELFPLGQDAFLGRHYDEVAALMSWLFSVDAGARRPGVLALLLRVMDGVAELGDFERLVGMSPEEADRRWRASLTR